MNEKIYNVLYNNNKLFVISFFLIEIFYSFFIIIIIDFIYLSKLAFRKRRKRL